MRRASNHCRRYRTVQHSAFTVDHQHVRAAIRDDLRLQPGVYRTAGYSVGDFLPGRAREVVGGKMFSVGNVLAFPDSETQQNPLFIRQFT